MFGTALAALVAVTGAAGCDLGALDGTPIGPRGGIVTSDDGRVTLEIPAAAVGETIAIRIVPTDDLPDDAAGPAYSIEPFGIAFSAPALLVYDVSDGLMDDDPHRVRLVTERDYGWDALADREVDSIRGEVSASVMFAANIGIVE